MRYARSRSIVVVDALEARRLLSAVPAGFRDAAFGDSIADGTAMAFAPDGRLFVLGQTGTVRIVSASEHVTDALALNVNSFNERGLIGLAFSPGFASDHQLFLYYTELPSGQASSYSGQTHNRIARFTVNGDTIDPASETLIVQLDTLSAGNHNGGAMAFGPDGKLYVGVGENGVRANAQSASTRLGKLLRLNADGSIPSDNPATVAGIGATRGVNRAIYAAGLRNPYTIAFDPADTAGDGTLYINDVGQNTFEEINVGGAGRNYGWPTTEGFFNASANANLTNPLYAYAHADTDTTGFAITGGAVYRSSAANGFGSAYDGKYFFGDFVNGWIDVLDPAAPPTSVSGATAFATGASGVVDVDVGPDGVLYHLDRGGDSPGVRRITALPRATVSLSGSGTLTIGGTDADDQVVLNFKGSKLRVIADGVATLFSPGRVKRIRIATGEGDDVVRLAAGVRGVGVDGGDGDDLLAGGDFADHLVGGDGRDTLIGYGGDDTLEGGAARDSLLAGDGDDMLIGGSSIDTLNGAAGRDRSDDDRREKRISIEVLA